MESPKLKFIFFGLSGRYTVAVLEKVAAKHCLVGIVESAPRCIKMDVHSSEFIRAAGRAINEIFKRVRKSYWLSDIAKKYKVPYFLLKQGNLPELEMRIKSMDADIGCIASFSQLLKTDIIGLFTKGIINLHPSLLPKFRGPNPWFWIYFEMEKTSGVTIHYIDAGEDTGDILLQAVFPITLGMPFCEMQDMATRLGADLMVQALNEIALNIQQPKSQYHMKRSPRARNIKRHENLIDWQNWPIERVWHVLRGSQLWLEALPPPPIRLFGLCVWQIKGYERTKGVSPVYGKIFKDAQGWYVTHREGKIHLKLDFRLSFLAS